MPDTGLLAVTKSAFLRHCERSEAIPIAEYRVWQQARRREFILLKFWIPHQVRNGSFSNNKGQKRFYIELLSLDVTYPPTIQGLTVINDYLLHFHIQKWPQIGGFFCLYIAVKELLFYS